MRVHITLDEDLVRELGRRAGARRRSAYIVHAVEQALDDDHRWELVESALGAMSDHGEESVREQRRGDDRRVG